jgi:hypothetical protein
MGYFSFSSPVIFSALIIKRQRDKNVTSAAVNLFQNQRQVHLDQVADIADPKSAGERKISAARRPSIGLPNRSAERVRPARAKCFTPAVNRIPGQGVRAAGLRGSVRVAQRERENQDAQRERE